MCLIVTTLSKNVTSDEYFDKSVIPPFPPLYKKKENRRLFNIIKVRCDYDQLILEKGGRWIHMSYVPPFTRANRQQVMYT